MAVELPFSDDPTEVFRRIAPLGKPVLLDSAGGERYGRWDIIAAAPDPQRTLMVPAHSAPQATDEALKRWRQASADVSALAQPAPDVETLPFHGGYIGHLSYSLGAQLLGVADAQNKLPMAVAHCYPWAVVQDRQERRSWLTGVADDARVRDIQHRLSGSSELTDAPFRLEEPFAGPWSLREYESIFARVKDYIRAGDCYQINLGQAFSAHFSGDLLTAYRALRGVARAPFSAFFPLDERHTLLCLSPERFLTVNRQGGVETRPIKGTRPRNTDTALDEEAAAQLLASEKERAENLMIVDLMRNDIGRFCEPSSVRVDELFALESYATVHHLVSAVRGDLAAGNSAADLLLGCLPGGSITGAPKHRAMEIIRELEVAPREAWCGSIFYLSNCGRMDSNITIRTLFNDGDLLHCWAGGGLVYDSLAAAEFQEQRHKVGAFIETLEGLGG